MTEARGEPIVLQPTLKDLGNLPVRRLLPAVLRRAVGPFVFFDHFGPTTIPLGANADVRPHPHIGLATVSYLFDGEMIHRDSIGSVATLRAGDGDVAVVCASEDAHVMLLGGAPLDGERHLLWNFASSSRERLERAKSDWRERRFPSIPGDDQEFIPLPP